MLQRGVDLLPVYIKNLGIQAWLTGTDESLFESFGGSAQYFKVADATVSLSGGGQNNIYLKGTGSDDGYTRIR